QTTIFKAPYLTQLLHTAARCRHSATSASLNPRSLGEGDKIKGGCGGGIAPSQNSPGRIMVRRDPSKIQIM
ncbi:hypothetical protein CDAR_547481, partial [Caerostris darwini]